MDILSEAFDAMRLRGGVYFRAEISGQWAIAIPSKRETARLHLVLQGDCFFRQSLDHEPVRLFDGDMVIVPGGRSHFLADRPGRQPIPLTQILGQHEPDENGTLRLEGKGKHRVRLLCGDCDFDTSLAHPAIATLPEVMVLKRSELGHDPWLTSVLRTAAMEADHGGFGMTAVLTRMLETIFIQAIRTRHLSENVTEVDFVKAISDPKISHVLKLIHASPELNWTITQLAKETGMSRSVLSERFAKKLGEPPMVYLRRWRLFRARALLRESNLDMLEIAEACGYSSVPSFSRRFTTAFGIGPGKFRKGTLPETQTY